MTSKNYTINVWDITPAEPIYSWKAKDTVNFLLWTIIQKLMIAIWAVSLLIMTIWGWYMILYHGQDEMLSKGKSIFTAWIIWVVIALSSYFLVSFVRFILYAN